MRMFRFFWTFTFFESTALLAITWTHVLKVDAWSSTLTGNG
jgi:hypothetical protein